MTHSKNFSFQKRSLTVKAAAFDEGWKVRVFEGDRQVTGVVYTVSHEVAVDASLQSVPTNLVEELMELAQSDIESGKVKLIP